MIANFLDNIARLRRHHKLTKKEMAAKLNISVWSLNKMEKGELPPRLTIDVLYRIYLVFGISMADFVSAQLEFDKQPCKQCEAGRGMAKSRK